MGTHRDPDAACRRTRGARGRFCRGRGQGARRAHRCHPGKAALVAFACVVAMKFQRAALWFVAPAVLVIGVFFLLPVVAALLMSLTDFDIYALADLRNLRFVGLANYTRLLGNPLFWQALGNTLYFVLVGVPLSIA